MYSNRQFVSMYASDGNNSVRALVCPTLLLDHDKHRAMVILYSIHSKIIDVDYV
jgi:hypothetical protein